MKCIICGKELTGKKRKYCSWKCAKIAFAIGLATPQENSEKKVAELFELFKKAFNMEEKITSLNSWKIRVFISACYERKYSANSIGRGIKKNHATVIRHYQKLKESEKKLALEFLKDPEHYRYYSQPKPIYPKGFHY